VATLPNPLGEPASVQSLHYGFDPEGFFAGARRRHGDVFTVEVIGETWTVLADPGAVKEVFAHGPTEMNSGEANLPLRPLIGTSSVFLADGEEHLARRRLVLPPFHGNRMRAYEEMIRTAAQQEAQTWPLDRPAPALGRLRRMTFGVILRCAFGVRDESRLRQVETVLGGMLDWLLDIRRMLVIGLAGPERLMAREAFKRRLADVDREIAVEIASRRADSDLERRPDILSLLIRARSEDGEGLSDRELRDELVTMLVAGHETSAATVAWALHELARSPGAQDEVASGTGDFSAAAITETLRLRPPVPIVLRRLREPLAIAGTNLPEGATVAPSTLLVHRRADIYPDPWAFRPERFHDRRPAASEWFPFGGSVRRCIGASFAQFESRLAIEELIGALEFRPARRRPERVWRRGPVLVPARGARLVATRR
jgi:cytochrome P450